MSTILYSQNDFAVFESLLGGECMSGLMTLSIQD